MRNFVRFTMVNDNPIYLAYIRIVAVSEAGNFRVVSLEGEYTIRVRDTLEEIVEQMDACVESSMQRVSELLD